MYWKYKQWYRLFENNDVVKQLVQGDFSCALQIPELFQTLIQSVEKSVIFEFTERLDHDVKKYTEEAIAEIHIKAETLAKRLPVIKGRIQELIKERDDMAKRLIKLYPESEAWKEFIQSIRIPEQPHISYEEYISRRWEEVWKKRMMDIANDAQRFKEIHKLLKECPEIRREIQRNLNGVNSDLVELSRPWGTRLSIWEKTKMRVNWKFSPEKDNTYNDTGRISDNLYQEWLESLSAYIIDKSNNKELSDKLLHHHSDKLWLFLYYFDNGEGGNDYAHYSLDNCITLYQDLSVEEQSHLFQQFKFDANFQKILSWRVTKGNMTTWNLFPPSAEDIKQQKIFALKHEDFILIEKHFKTELYQAIEFVLFNECKSIAHERHLITIRDRKKILWKKQYVFGLFRKHLIDIEEKWISEYGYKNHLSDSEKFILTKIYYNKEFVHEKVELHTKTSMV